MCTKCRKPVADCTGIRHAEYHWSQDIVVCKRKGVSRLDGYSHEIDTLHVCAEHRTWYVKRLANKIKKLVKEIDERQDKVRDVDAERLRLELEDR